MQAHLRGADCRAVNVLCLDDAFERMIGSCFSDWHAHFHGPMYLFIKIRNEIQIDLQFKIMRQCEYQIRVVTNRLKKNAP